MDRINHWIISKQALCICLALCAAHISPAQMASRQTPLPNLDLRPAKARDAVVTPEKATALGHLKEGVPGLKAEFDPVSG